jgi:hypothetical protein
MERKKVMKKQRKRIDGKSDSYVAGGGVGNTVYANHPVHQVLSFLYDYQTAFFLFSIGNLTECKNTPMYLSQGCLPNQMDLKVEFLSVSVGLSSFGGLLWRMFIRSKQVGSACKAGKSNASIKHVRVVMHGIIHQATYKSATESTDLMA